MINPDLIKYFDKYINKDMDDLTKAVRIYILLNMVVKYDKKYYMDEFHFVNSVAKINEKNNELTCYQWSVLYEHLLTHYGIFAYWDAYECAHYYANFAIDGVVYKADATIHGFSKNEYKMSDIARVKFGFDSLNIYPKYHEKEQEEKIQKIKNELYDELNLKIISREHELKLIDSVKKRFKEDEVGTFSDVKKRIDYLNRFYLINFDKSSVEKNIFIGYLIHLLFADYHNKNIHNLYDVNKNLLKLMIIKLKNGDYLYILENINGFEVLDFNKFINIVKERKLNSISKIEEFGNVKLKKLV